MGRLLSEAYSAIPFRGVIPIPPAKSTAGRSSSRTKSPRGPCSRTVSPGRREGNARATSAEHAIHRRSSKREKGELDGTKREPNWLLHNNPMSGERKLVGGG